MDCELKATKIEYIPEINIEEIILQSGILLDDITRFTKRVMNSEYKNSQEFLDFLDSLNKLSIQW